MTDIFPTKMIFTRKTLYTAVLACAALAATAQAPAPYLDESLPADVRIEDAIGRMTLDEKIAIRNSAPRDALGSVFPRYG